MRFDVRNTGGTLYGSLEIHDLTRLLTGTVRFARARNARYYGSGFRELPAGAMDISFRTIDLAVSQWATPPAIGEHGGYFPGRIDYILIWDGPLLVLEQVRGFRAAP